MGLFIEEEIELSETGLVVSNVYLSFDTRTFNITQYQYYLKKTPAGDIVPYAPDSYVIANAIEFYNKDKSVNYEHTNVIFFVSKEDISTIPLYNLAYRELKKLYPTAKDSI